MELRQQKGMEICKQKQVKPTREGWLVQSQSGAGSYKVDELFNCSCPDAQFHKATCKHAYAVRYFIKAEIETPQGKVIQEKRITYPQAWAAYTKAQNEEVKLFDELLSDLVAGIETPAHKTGRPFTPYKDAVFCAVQKVYSQLSSRRAYSLYRHSKNRGQVGKTPNYNVINLLLNKPELTPILQELISVTAAPLKDVETDWAVDSSGFRTRCFCQYAEQKYDLKREHKFVKAHIITGVKTNIVSAVEITPENGADAPKFPVLVQKTADGGFTVKEVSADKAYGSAENYNAVAGLGGQAYIPFKSNASGQSHGIKYRLWRKMYHYFQLNQQEFFEHYHKRSNVETTFSAIKKKLGDTLKSKNPIAQENELLCKILAYNLTVVIHEMHELGIKPDFKV
ncbi:MAG: transposase [Candidatus Micrarchaeota archaeon]